MPLEQIGQALRFDFFYTTSGVGTTGLTVTADVYDYAGTKVVTDGACTEIGGGLYTYSMALGFNTARGNYRAVGKTATTTVDQRQIAALWVSGLPWLERIDAAISAVAALSATAVWGSVARTLTDKTGFSLSAAGIQAIWDALTSALTTVGSVGKRIADNLDVTVNSRLATAGYTAPDNAGIATIQAAVDTEIAAIKAKTDTLGSGTVTTVSPVADGGDVTIRRGDDYSATDGRELSWTSDSWPNLTGATIAVAVQTPTAITYAGAVVTPTGSAVIRLELTAAQTAALAAGLYSYDIQATLSGGHVVTLVAGRWNVLVDVR